MALIRWILGGIILSLDALFSPKPLERSPADQARVDHLTGKLALYQFQACPFCVKVRRALRRMNLKVELRDAKLNPAFGAELKKEGGELQVPCLRIPQADGSAKWLYESDAIIAFLRALA